MLATAIANRLGCARHLEACSIYGPRAGMAVARRRCRTTWAACTNRVRRYLLPRLEILPSKVRSPVDYCFGTRPSQAPKSRPCLKPLPVPIVATTALEMIGPIPGTVIRCWQAGSFLQRLSISSERHCDDTALVEADEVEGVLADVETDLRNQTG